MEYRILVDLLRELREEKSVRQEELAQRLGKDQPFVSRYERRERRLDFTEVRAIVRALGMELVSFAELFETKLREAGGP